MAIADYDSLVAAIKSYAARSDRVFSARIPDFVGLAEDRLYNGSGEPGDPTYTAPVRSKALEAADTITLTAGVGTIPDDALELRRLYRADDRIGITYQPPERLSMLEANATGTLPVYFTVVGSELRTAPAYDGDLSIDYYKRYDPVTSSATTGVLLSAHSLLYLEACLFEAFSFMQEVELAMAHLAKLRGMIAGVNRTAAALRYSGPLRTRPRVVFP